MANDLVYNEELINLLIEKLKPGIQPEGIELKRLLFSSRLDEDFYEVFKIYLPVGKLTVEELDMLTGYSKKFIEERKTTIDTSPLPQQALKNALKLLESVRQESNWAIILMRHNLTFGEGKEWFALRIKEASYNSTVNPIYKNLNGLYDFHRANSKLALAKFFEDALIGYSIAHCEAFLYKLRSELKANKGDEDVLGSNELSPQLRPIKEFFIHQKGPHSYEEVLKKLAPVLQEENGRLIIVPPIKKVKIKNEESKLKVTWVAGLYKLLLEKKVLSITEHSFSLRDIFLNEFDFEISEYNTKVFQSEILAINKKVKTWQDMWDKRSPKDPK